MHTQKTLTLANSQSKQQALQRLFTLMNERSRLRGSDKRRSDYDAKITAVKDLLASRYKHSFRVSKWKVA